ncbi:DUF4268 domain-containing protein [Amycolatopsis samaneae]|uniref:DUF4268 domain-containing protein n=1 Tax=Amycolatopsis samaneae TaxID=664691 RepID=A0ABW5GI73_9PSEU
MGIDALGLGRLERLANPRDIWQHEAVDFTPWLAANIEVLSDAIGLPLTVVAQEVHVGEFRLDIQATDPDGRPVIIENQLEPSDHMHLGQLLVYASGLEASTVIWITTRLRDEHRSALTWLNERTDSDVRVFGIELSVVRIGDSAKAPVLDVVLEPNDWSKAAKETSKAVASSRNQPRMAFFEEVFDLLTQEYPAIRTPRIQPANWCSFAGGPFGYYALTFSKQGYRIELYLDMQESAGQQATKHLFDFLYQQHEAIHRELGFELVWERLEDKRASRISVYNSGFVLEDADEAQREQAVRWTVDQVVRLHGVLDSKLRGAAAQLKNDPTVILDFNRLKLLPLDSPVHE